MKLKTLLLATALLSPLAMAGEDRVMPETEKVVGKLADGRVVKQVEIYRSWDKNHFVYFIDKADVTNNYSVSSGKTTRLETLPTFSESSPVETKEQRRERVAQCDASTETAGELFDCILCSNPAASATTKKACAK